MTRSKPADTAPQPPATQSPASQAAIATAALLLVLTSAAPAADPGPPDFNRDIRPILSGRCFACHGPDAEDREAGLRLDLRDAAIGPLADGGTAIVPGKPEASGLIARVTSSDPDIVMPPPRVGKPVTPAEADLLRRWIAAGAEYRGHFAFQKIERPAAPEVRRRDWSRTPIDRFILARLEAEGLAPAGEADRPTLIRRLTLDMLGLPPTPEEVDAFVADTAADAYDRVVDRLLADRRFGERMALEWLDAARYADSHGYQVDASRANWPWRDWVIAAFNNNMPFDQFTIEQLAGDMLPDATTEQIVATGFNRNHRLNNEGGIIPEEWRVETVIDRVETTGQTWLGLSVGCARCHDHKYDPLSQREFYGLFAIFNNVPESGMGNDSGGNVAPVRRVPTPEQAKEIARLEAALAAAERSLKGEHDAIDDHVATWEKALPAVRERPADAWQHLEPATTTSTGKATFRRSEDGSWVVEGPEPPTDVYEIRAPLSPGSLGGLRLEVLPGEQGLARGAGDRVVVTKIEAEIERPGGPPVPVKLERAAADAAQPGWAAENVLKGDRAKGWAVEGGPEQAGPRRLAVFPSRPVAVPADARLVIRIRQESPTPGLTIAAFRLAVSSSPPGLLDAAGFTLPDAVAAVLGIAPAQRTPEQAGQLRKFYADSVGGPIWQAEVARDEAKRRLESFNGPLPTAMVMQEGPRRDAFLLIRGEYDKRGDKVEAALPAFLPPPPAGTPINRLSFARWLVSREHPLTARVWVNRQWERFFGIGLVKSSENLGSQADYPSHPQLLDWMAADFVESGWDMKRFVRQLVTSAVYRQSSRLAPGMQERDPENRLLARAPRIRLPGEIIRDAALAAGGLLVPTIGGPSVRPWMPDGVWDETTKYGDLRNYKPDTGEGRYRRTMYTLWKRTAGPPTMLLFDAPGREICTVRRSRTNTPLQALALLNEMTFVEAANGLARRMVAEGTADPAARIERGFRLAVGRRPSAAELRTLVGGFEADRGRFAADPAATKKYLAVGLVRKPDGIADDEFAAYALTANVLLNLDEFVMRD